MTLGKNTYNDEALQNTAEVCGHRLGVRTAGFHPVNRSSILRGRTINISRGREVVSRQAHNLEITGSIPVSATKNNTKLQIENFKLKRRLFHVCYLIFVIFFCQCSSVG